MNKVMMSLAVGLAAATVFADGAVRTSYADPNMSHNDALRAEREGVSSVG